MQVTELDETPITVLNYLIIGDVFKLASYPCKNYFIKIDINDILELGLELLPDTFCALNLNTNKIQVMGKLVEVIKHIEPLKIQGNK